MKLFGTTISPPESLLLPDSRQKSDLIPAPASSNEKGMCRQEAHNLPEASAPAVKEEPARPNCSSGVKSGRDENQTSVEDNRSAVDPNPEEEQMDKGAASGEQKVLKKIDKIIPCPRCNSMDTKFCYYNNYNVNQPRHFCRNCQRYWTAGGIMRNVPVGAGRRKNKHSVPDYCRIVMPSDGMPAAHVEASDLASHQVLPCMLPDSLKGNGTVLNFGPHVPPNEPIGAMLNLGDKKKKTEQGSVACVGNGDEPSCGSTVTASSCLENELPKAAGWMEQEPKPVCCSVFPPLHLQYYPGQPWSYPWGSGWNNVAAMTPGRRSSELDYEPENGNSGLVQWNSLPMVAAPPFCAPSIPFPFLPPSAYWGSMPGWAGGSWDVPWGLSKCSRPLSSSPSNSVCSGNGSRTLGKHSRDLTLKDEEKTEVSVGSKDAENYDPDESAKCSIRATLGTKLEPATKGIYKAFQLKTEAKDHILNAKQVLQANPAALARSRMFQEKV